MFSTSKCADEKYLIKTIKKFASSLVTAPELQKSTILQMCIEERSQICFRQTAKNNQVPLKRC